MHNAFQESKWNIKVTGHASVLLCCLLFFRSRCNCFHNDRSLIDSWRGLLEKVIFLQNLSSSLIFFSISPFLLSNPPPTSHSPPSHVASSPSLFLQRKPMISREFPPFFSKRMSNNPYVTLKCIMLVIQKRNCTKISCCKDHSSICRGTKLPFTLSLGTWSV